MSDPFAAVFGDTRGRPKKRKLAPDEAAAQKERLKKLSYEAMDDAVNDWANEIMNTPPPPEHPNCKPSYSQQVQVVLDLEEMYGLRQKYSPKL